MKRIVAMVALAGLLLGLCPGAAAEAEVVSIGSREEMLRIAEDPAGHYELSADIDMGSGDWTPLPFSGVLEGHGHTLYNLKVTAPGPDRATTFDGNAKEYDTVFGGLFSVVTGAEIRDVNLVNAAVDITTEEHCFVAALAGYAKDSVISGCSVQARNHLTLSSVNAGVGGLAGFSVYSTFSGCTVDAELVFTDTNRDALCEEFLAGVFTCGCGDVLDCTVRTRGYAEIYGYAHNGGVIGMIKLPKSSKKLCTLGRTTVDADISFFEVTPSRRAYCAALIGENLGGNCYITKNKVTAFRRNEVKAPAKVAPEACETPQYTEEVTAGDCGHWGYTTHTCAGCGYSYRDSYTPPVHQFEVSRVVPAACTAEGETEYTCSLCGAKKTEPIPAAGHDYEETVLPPTCTEPGAKVFTCKNCGNSYSEPIPAAGHTAGDWEVAIAPQVDVPGEEQRKCAVCGEVMERRELAALPYVHAEGISLSHGALELRVGEEALLEATLTPKDATENACTYVSSDETVARVDASGAVWGAGPGTAVVRATSADGRVSADCTVTVSYTAWQWVKHYVLFGWAWE